MLLLTVAMDLIRRHGFAGTSVNDLCAAAGAKKRAFFHHLVSKEALGVAMVRHRTEITGAMFAAHDYDSQPIRWTGSLPI
ncbi:MAG: helix-turn-helix domain-containing protein [Pseudomonadota bacterium]